MELFYVDEKAAFYFIENNNLNIENNIIDYNINSNNNPTNIKEMFKMIRDSIIDNGEDSEDSEDINEINDEYDDFLDNDEFNNQNIYDFTNNPNLNTTSTNYDYLESNTFNNHISTVIFFLK